MVYFRNTKFVSILCNTGPIAQWLELLTHNQCVVGSNPTGTTYNLIKTCIFYF